MYLIQTLIFIIPIIIIILSSIYFYYYDFGGQGLNDYLSKYGGFFAGFFLIAVAVCSAIAWGLYAIDYRNKVYFNEIWNNYFNEVRYYQKWDEKVSCRHPEYCTRQVTRHHTDSEGHSYTTTETETYQCGWKHSYDVDFHPERWEAILETGDAFSISKAEYDFRKNLWCNETFVDLNRHYHSIDGDMFKSMWNQKISTVFQHSSIHSYKNKVRNSKSIFSSQKTSTEFANLFGKSPAETGNLQVIYAYGLKINTELENDYLQKLNALNGSKYQIHCMIILFNANKYQQTIINDLKSAWNGVNKNELVICVGLNEKQIAWCESASWMDNTTIHAKIRQDVFDLKNYNGIKIADIADGNVKKLWQRKHFRDFEYLSVQVSNWVYISGIISTLVINIIAFIGCYNAKKY